MLKSVKRDRAFVTSVEIATMLISKATDCFLFVVVRRKFYRSIRGAIDSKGSVTAQMRDADALKS